MAALSARVWHWLMVSAVPMFVAIALFAPLVIRVTMGPRYADATALVRILAIYGAVSVGTNLAGNLLVAAGRLRALYAQSGAAIVGNIVANLLLIPLYGVYASAWITVATEIFVCVCAFWSARDLWSVTRMLEVSIRPLVALGVASASAAVVGQETEVGAVVVFIVMLVACLLITKSWPEEFALGRLRRT